MAKKGLSNSNDCEQRTFTANLLDKYLLVFQAHLKIVENQIKNNFQVKIYPIVGCIILLCSGIILKSIKYEQGEGRTAEYRHRTAQLAGGQKAKGLFTNYVDKILVSFDHLTRCVDIFYGRTLTKSGHFWTT